MNAEHLKQIFPRASESFLKANRDDPGSNPSSPKELLVKADKNLSIKQRLREPSKLQAAFFEQLKVKGVCDGGLVMEEDLTLMIANGCRYTPDCWEIGLVSKGGRTTHVRLKAYEVKGAHAWDDSIVKLKVAARTYPWIEFYLVTRPTRFDDWKISRVEA